MTNALIDVQYFKKQKTSIFSQGVCNQKNRSNWPSNHCRISCGMWSFRIPLHTLSNDMGQKNKKIVTHLNNQLNWRFPIIMDLKTTCPYPTQTSCLGAHLGHRPPWSKDIVDGRNPAPVDTGFFTSHVVIAGFLPSTVPKIVQQKAPPKGRSMGRKIDTTKSLKAGDWKDLRATFFFKAGPLILF